MGGLLLVQLLRLTIFYAEPEIRDVYCPLVDTLMRSMEPVLARLSCLFAGTLNDFSTNLTKNRRSSEIRKQYGPSSFHSSSTTSCTNLL